MALGEKEHVARTLEGKLLEVLLLILRPSLPGSGAVARTSVVLVLICL